MSMIRLVGALLLLLGGEAMAIEEPAYRVLEKHGELEVRAYAPHVVAAVEVEGERGEALSRGFRLLANYIFGNNRSRTKVEMTAPVASQAAPEKLAMTAPVGGQQVSEGRWKVTFVMPSAYSLETLPAPNDARVRHEAVPGQRVATWRFSGWASDGNVRSALEDFQAGLKAHGLRPRGEPTLAQYNPPWSLPFWRRNEWCVELEDVPVVNAADAASGEVQGREAPSTPLSSP
jgi:hypothetical protein